MLHSFLRIGVTLVTVVAISSSARAQSDNESPDPLFFGAMDRARAEAFGQRPAPRLAVLLVFDMLPYRFLDRLSPVVPDGGFRRLLTEGAVYTQCEIPYAVTLTGPGHATLATGAAPWVHGVVGNNWYDQDQGKFVYCVDDPSAIAVGGESLPSCSPWRMKSQTLGDALRTQTRGLGKVISIGGKDRAAVLTGGHNPNGVYWIDRRSALLQSSTFYHGERLPAWVEEVNRNADTRAALDAAWEPFLSPEKYLSCVPHQSGETLPRWFTEEEKSSEWSPLLAHPYGIDLVFDGAQAAVTGEELGQDAICDLLVVAVSATDPVGHEYGPDSVEFMDMYARADARLREFLQYLDRTVGRGKYVVGVSSDHGACHNVEYAELFAVGAQDSIGGLRSHHIVTWANGVLDAAFEKSEEERSGDWAHSFYRGFYTFNVELLDRLGVGLVEACAVLVDSSATNPWIGGAYSPHDARPGTFDSPLAPLARRSTYGGRSGHVILTPAPQAFFSRPGRQRADHGSPYLYDRHVPFLLWGWGVDAELVHQPASTTDMAPTLARLMGIDPPTQSEGQVRVEALDIPEASWEPGGGR